MNGPKSRNPQITSQNQQQTRANISNQPVSYLQTQFSNDKGQQQAVPYYSQQPIQYNSISNTPPHDHKLPAQYMSAPATQQPSVSGPPAGAPGASQIGAQVNVMFQPRVQGSQQPQYYQPRPQQPPQRAPRVMNTGQQPGYQYTPGPYQVMSSTAGPTGYPQQQIIMAPNMMMYPQPRMPMYVQQGYVQQMPTTYATPDQWMAPQYQPQVFQPQAPPQATQYMPQQPNRPPSAGQLYVAPAQQQAPVPSSQPVHRERKILRICDPNSGEDKTDEIIGQKKGTPPHSGSTSSRSTPNTQSNPSVAAQFAQQVAATLKPSDKQEKGDARTSVSEEGTEHSIEHDDVSLEFANEVVASLQREEKSSQDEVKQEYNSTEIDVSVDVVDSHNEMAVTEPVTGHVTETVSVTLPETLPETKPCDSASKDEGKKKQKQRVKQYEEKGKAKEGSDMDVFTDSSSAPEPVVPPTTETPPSVQPTPSAPETNHVAEPAVVDAPATPAEYEAEKQDPVKEKNDKNHVVAEEKKPAPKPELKYNYKEDQWSPLNPEGKKQYDREFLLSLQDQFSSRTKPENLPDLPDVILNQSRSNDQYQKLMSKPASFDFFTPGYVKSSMGGTRQGSANMGRRGSQQGGKGSRDMKPRVIEIPQQPPVELHKAETSWMKQREKKRELLNTADQTALSDVDIKTEELYCKVRGILNKLTPQKFAKLLTQIQALEINTEKRLTGVINLIFEKAIDEPNFSVPYALLCKTLAGITVPPDNPGGKPVTFRVKLLARCQAEFEKDRDDELDLDKRKAAIEAADTEEKKRELQIELEEAKAKSKRRSTGNIRFIGELFKLKMLTEKIMHQCLTKLLDAGTEEDLECLCRLFTTIGKGIDSNDDKTRIDQYFKRMQTMIDNKQSSSRIRFLMLDVIDLRKNNWVNRRGTNDPKTIDQIHKEAALEKEREAAQEERNRQNVTLNRPKGGQNRGQGQGQGQSRMADDGWTTVQTKNQDMSRVKLTKQNIDENVQLGPSLRLGPGSSWSRGSTGGSGGKQAEQDSRSGMALSGNRFSLFNDGRGRGAGRGTMTPPGRQQDNRGRPQQAMGKRPVGPRGSIESERESALAAVRSQNTYRSISGGMPPRRGSLGGSSRDNSRSRDGSQNRDYQQRSRDPSPRAVEEPTPVASDKSMSRDAMEAKAKAILEEYLHVDDKKEALLCISELQGQKLMDVFVETCINHVLERSESARKHTAFLLRDCLKKEYIPEEAWLAAMRSTTELGEDFEIDIPKIWQYLAELIGPMMEDGLIPMSCLPSICLPIQAPSKRGRLAVAVLEYISHREGHGKAGALWRNGNLSWSDFVDYDEEEMEAFIRENKLEYTLAGPDAVPAVTLTDDEIRTELAAMLKRAAEDEEIFDWIEANVGEARCKDPKFIRILMTEVCNSAIIVSGTAPALKYEKKSLEPRSHVLQKYIDHDAELELQAIYALQALVHSLEHPPGLLRFFFEELYDLEVLSEDAFKSWSSSSEPSERQGFAVAKKAVNQFLGTLNDEDDDDEGLERS